MSRSYARSIKPSPTAATIAVACSTAIRAVSIEGTRSSDPCRPSSYIRQSSIIRRCFIGSSPGARTTNFPSGAFRRSPRIEPHVDFVDSGVTMGCRAASTARIADNARRHQHPASARTRVATHHQRSSLDRSSRLSARSYAACASSGTLLRRPSPPSSTRHAEPPVSRIRANPTRVRRSRCTSMSMRSSFISISRSKSVNRSWTVATSYGSCNKLTAHRDRSRSLPANSPRARHRTTRRRDPACGPGYLRAAGRERLSRFPRRTDRGTKSEPRVFMRGCYLPAALSGLGRLNRYATRAPSNTSTPNCYHSPRQRSPQRHHLTARPRSSPPSSGYRK